MMIICGWYTANYAAYKDKLVASIETANMRCKDPVLRLRYDFIEVTTDISNWAAITRLKAGVALEMMDRRHAGDKIVLIDVDAEIVGSVRDVHHVLWMDADVGVRLSSEPQKGSLIWPNSALLVLHPTSICRDLLFNWKSVCDIADEHAPDENSLAVALASTPGLAIYSLPIRARPLCGENVSDAVFRFASASTELDLKPKISRTSM